MQTEVLKTTEYRSRKIESLLLSDKMMTNSKELKCRKKITNLPQPCANEPSSLASIFGWKIYKKLMIVASRQ